MKTVFICSPFRGATPWDVAKNVQVAEKESFNVAIVGGVPVCPQSMYRNFDKTIDDEFWLNACQELLRRCDAVFVSPDQTMSKGCVAEIELAMDLKLPVFYYLWELEEWLKCQ